MLNKHRNQGGIRFNSGESTIGKEVRRSRKREPFPKKSGGILCKGNRLTVYRFIEENKDEFGLRWLFKRCNVYPNGYYNYLKHRKQAYRKKAEFL